MNANLQTSDKLVRMSARPPSPLAKLRVSSSRVTMLPKVLHRESLLKMIWESEMARLYP